jgi:hypothetical protein
MDALGPVERCAFNAAMASLRLTDRSPPCDGTVGDANTWGDPETSFGGEVHPAPRRVHINTMQRNATTTYFAILIPPFTSLYEAVKDIPVGFGIGAQFWMFQQIGVFPMTTPARELKKEEFPFAEAVWEHYRQQKADQVADRIF